jgi:hypothetical protein
MLINRCCANCGVDCKYLKEDGVSSLYFPGEDSIRLCAPCFHEEDALIDEVGTNNMPDRLSHYLSNIARLG